MQTSTIWRCLLLTLTFLPVTTVVQAQPDLNQSSATSDGGCLYICPTGDGQSLDTITVTLLNGLGSPVVDFPRERIWADAISLGDLVYCDTPFLADAPTDDFGMTTISGTARGGGHTNSGLYVYVDGLPIQNSPLDFTIVSPDIDGNLVVDVCDVAILGSDFQSAAYRSDFTCDGTVDLADFTVFTPHLCHYCPDDSPYENVEQSGEVGIFFDAAGTQSGILDVPVGGLFTFYVVATSAPGGISGYEFGVDVDAGFVTLIAETTYPIGMTYRPYGSIGDVNAGIAGPCLPEVGPILLAEYQAVNQTSTTQVPICLRGSGALGTCLPDDTRPAYTDCAQCAWRYFGSAYDGCAVLNGTGPIAAEPTTWSAIKGLYRN